MRYSQNPAPSWLARAATIAVLLAGVVVAGFGLLWYLSYGFDPDPPARVIVPPLEAPVQITWGEDDFTAIQAATEVDAWAALGYAHGLKRTWTLMLWRQAALGRLGEWLGQPAEPIDALSRQLGLARLAQTGFDDLTPEEKKMLRAYTAGVNTAFSTSSSQFQPEIVALDIYPTPWEAWHSLAVERLFAWLAVDLPEPPAGADSSVRAFVEADRMLRQHLHLHGFENSLAWVARDSVSTHLYHRLVYGASALPFLMESSVAWQDSSYILTGPSLPGTTLFPFGHTNTSAWALLPTSTASFVRVGRDSTRGRGDALFEHLRFRDGSEQVLAFHRQGDRLVLPGNAPQADTVWALSWPGLVQVTDLPAWRQLGSGEAPAFRLLDGHALRLGSDGSWSTLGAPPVSESLQEGQFIAASPWAAYAAELLRTQDPGEALLRTWIDDTYSVWAARTAPGLLSHLTSIDSTTAADEALTYLRNWDFAYDRSSIAASIFDTWLSFYQDTTGALPQPTPRTDSTFVPDPILQHTFERTVALLLDRFGPDLRQWRWEEVQSDRLLFPLWSADSLGKDAAGESAPARFAPLDLPGYGHPTTIAWGPSPITGALPAPAAWEGWIQLDHWDALMTRRRTLAPYRPLGRYLLSDRMPDPVTLHTLPPDAETTRLVPVGSKE